MLVVVAGGSGSGKTTVAEALREAFDPRTVEIIPMDAYYRDRPDLTFAERQDVDYDRPEAIEFDLLVDHLRNLGAGLPVLRPDFDFEQYRRKEVTTRVSAAAVLVLEGVFGLSDERIIRMSEVKIFLDAPDDLRFGRRLSRDMIERGRTRDSIRRQWQHTVLPGHITHVAPSGQRADIVIDTTFDQRRVVDLAVQAIRSSLET